MIAYSRQWKRPTALQTAKKKVRTFDSFIQQKNPSQHKTETGFPTVTVVTSDRQSGLAGIRKSSTL
jgi:hypothetical protein